MPDDQVHAEASASASTRETPEEGSSVLGFFILAGVAYYFAVWRQTAVPTVRAGVAVAILVGFAIARALLTRHARGRETWATFLERTKLATILGFAILGAATTAVVFGSDDRALGVKLFAVAFFSALPAWLYWLFLTRKGPALWDEYVLNLHRLGIDRPGSLPEPTPHSVFHGAWRADRERLRCAGLGGEDNLYRKKFEGAFGTVLHDPARAVFASDSALPVVVATMLISVCWAVVLQPESVFGIGLLPRFTWTSRPAVPIEELRFAFLGAYFYVLQMLVRRFYANDLKASAYVNATVRIVIVLLLTWILGAIWTAERTLGWRLGVAFTIGVLPDVGWQLLQRAIKVPLARATNAFKQRYPLSELDGFNLWYESRLVEEGIEDMQTLVTANLVDLLLQTRVPVERIVDWLDQATLALHLSPGTEPTSPREVLRRYGIRTATDLLDAYDRPNGRWRVPGIERVLNGPTDAPDAAIVLDAVLTSLRREPVLVHVRRWKSFVSEHLRTGDAQRWVAATEATYPGPVAVEVTAPVAGG